MEKLPPGISTSDRVVLFDGECVMCNAAAQLLIRADKRRVFMLGTVQSPEGRAVLLWHDLPTEVYSSFILSEGSRLYLKSSALIRICRQLGFPWNLLATFWILPKPLRDRLYDLIAKHRYRIFGRRDQCVVLDPADGVRLLSPRSAGARRDA